MSRVSNDLFNDSVDKIAAGGWNRIKRVGKNFVKTLKGENVNQAQQALDAGNKKYQGIIDKWKQNQKNIDALKSKADNWREVKPLSFWDRTVNKVKGDEVYNWLNKVEVGESQLGKQNILDKIKMLQDKSSGIAGQAAHVEGKLQSLEEALKSAEANTFATRLATGGAVAAVPGTYLASKALSSDKEKESAFPGSDLWSKFKNNPDAQKAGIGAALGGLTGAGLGYLTEGSGKGAVLGGLAGAGFGGYSGYNYDRMFGDKSSAVTYSPYLTDKIAGPRWDSVKRFGNLVTGKTFRNAGRNYSAATTPITQAIADREAQIAVADHVSKTLKQQKIRQLVQRGKLNSSMPKLPNNAPELQYRELTEANRKLQDIVEARKNLLLQDYENGAVILNPNTGAGRFADVYVTHNLWPEGDTMSVEKVYRDYLRYLQNPSSLPNTITGRLAGLPKENLTQPQIKTLLHLPRIPEARLAEMFDTGADRINYMRKFGINPQTKLPFMDAEVLLYGADEASALAGLTGLNKKAGRYKQLLADKAKIESKYNRYLQDKQKYDTQMQKWVTDRNAVDSKLLNLDYQADLNSVYKEGLGTQVQQLADNLTREKDLYSKVYSDTINARAKAVAGTLGAGALGLGVYGAYNRNN